MAQDTTLEFVGRRIREERQRRQLSLDEVAQSVGVDKSQLSRIETGQRKLDSLLLRRLATALRVGMDVFFVEAPAGVTIKARRGDADDARLDAMVEWGQRKLGELRFVEQEVQARGLR